MNDDFVNAIQKKLGVKDEDVALYENKVSVILLDDFEKPKTFREWQKEKDNK